MHRSKGLLQAYFRMTPWSLLALLISPPASISCLWKGPVSVVDVAFSAGLNTYDFLILKQITLRISVCCSHTVTFHGKINKAVAMATA